MSDAVATRSERAADDSALPSGSFAAAPLPDGRLVVVRRALPADAPDVLRVIHAAFAGRPVRSNLPAALSETDATIRAAIEACAGFMLEVDGEAAAATILSHDGDAYQLGRVAVRPKFQRLGLATMLVSALLEALALNGVARVTLLVRKEYPEIGRWWAGRGFQFVSHEGEHARMAAWLPVVVGVPDADAMRDLGRRVAVLMRPGDVIIASGDLGAGKTTFAQGLGAGLGVDGPVISPTFVLSRVHRARSGGPGLVHVDAYRLGDAAELDDLDLDASLDDSVTFVEWGSGIAEGLSDVRLAVDIRRGIDPADDTRWVFLNGIGGRWSRAELEAAARPEENNA